MQDHNVSYIHPQHLARKALPIISRTFSQGTLALLIFAYQFPVCIQHKFKTSYQFALSNQHYSLLNGQFVLTNYPLKIQSLILAKGC